MSHIRYPRAAVAVCSPQPRFTPKTCLTETSTPSAVLWASIAMPAHAGGSVVGVRRRGESEVEVAWLVPGRTSIQWSPARQLLSEQDARRWLKTARFSR